MKSTLSFAVLALLGLIDATSINNLQEEKLNEIYPPDEILLQVETQKHHHLNENNFVSKAPVKHAHHQPSQTIKKQESKNSHSKKTESKSTHKSHQNKALSEISAQEYGRKPRGTFMYPDTLPGHEWWELDDADERLEGTRASDHHNLHDANVGDAPEDIRRVGNDHTPLHNAKLSPTGYYTGFFAKDYQGNYVQYQDEKENTESIQDQDELVNIDNYQKKSKKIEWNDYIQSQSSQALEEIMKSQQMWDKKYEEEEEDNSFEFLQTNFNDQNLLLQKSKQIPHENDTDDVAIDIQSDLGYNNRHSRLWNEAVNKQAMEMENQMRIIDNMALAQKKAKEDAQRKAAEEIQRREALKKKQEEEMRSSVAGKNSSAVLKKNHRTIDLDDLYSNMVPENKLLLQRVGQIADEMRRLDKDDQLIQIRQKIVENGMTPDDSTLLSFDHEHDTDDVVPELNEDMKLVQKANEQKQKVLRDFEGKEYEEYYDE